MCRYCEAGGDDCEVFIDPLTNEWYLSVPTSQWDSYYDDFFHERVYGIRFCPYCGRELTGK